MYLLLKIEFELSINHVKLNICRFWFEKIIASAVKLRKQTVKHVFKLISPGKHDQRASLQLQSVMPKHVLEIPTSEVRMDSQTGARARILNIV